MRENIINIYSRFAWFNDLVVLKSKFSSNFSTSKWSIVSFELFKKFKN
jgi:hypothetical protein